MKLVYKKRPEIFESYKKVREENGEILYRRTLKIFENNIVEYCGDCGKIMCSRFTNYCPNCGAKVDKEEEKE